MGGGVALVAKPYGIDVALRSSKRAGCQCCEGKERKNGTDDKSHGDRFLSAGRPCGLSVRNAFAVISSTSRRRRIIAKSASGCKQPDNTKVSPRRNHSRSSQERASHRCLNAPRSHWSHSAKLFARAPMVPGYLGRKYIYAVPKRNETDPGGKTALGQNAFRQKRCFALMPCFGASLRFLPSLASCKTLWHEKGAATRR